MTRCLIVLVGLIALTGLAQDANIAWDAPAQYTTGEPLDTVAEYRVYAWPGQPSWGRTEVIDSAPDTPVMTTTRTQVTITGIPERSWHIIAVTAVDAFGNESPLSEALCWAWSSKQPDAPAAIRLVAPTNMQAAVWLER